MESGKSKENQKKVKCALCHIYFREGSKTSHAVSAHGRKRVLFECGYCQQEFREYKRNGVKSHIRRRHKEPDGTVNLNNFKDLRRPYRKEITELRNKCFPHVAKKGEQEESHDYWDEYSYEPLDESDGTDASLYEWDDSDVSSDESRPELQCNTVLYYPYSVTNHACSHAHLDDIEEKNHMDQNGKVKDNRKKSKKKSFPVASNTMQCVLCNFVLTRAKSKTNHACSHANLVIYECNHCPRKFNNHDGRTIVKKHIRNHHKRNGQLVSEVDYKDNRKKLANEIQDWKTNCFPNHN